MRRSAACSLCCFVIVSVIATRAQELNPVEVKINWKSSSVVNRTTLTLQAVQNPFLRRGSATHDKAWQSMRELGASYARLALWYPYPRMSVAELSPPGASKTSWDLSAIDPLVEDFFSAVNGRPAVMCFSTIPQWMFAGTSNPPLVPPDPDTAVWNYEQGTALRDSSLREISDYYERVARWYMRGGLQDELGVWHSSGHHYKPAYWEVFNEPEYEHNFNATEYTRIYDAITTRLHHVNGHLKFTGASLAVPDQGEEFFEYFLDHSHHAPNAHLDAISYHFYALEKQPEAIETEAPKFFAQADHFLETVNKIEAIRRRLSPATETQINETGCIAAGDQGEGPEKMSGNGISPSYWNLCAATFAYVAGNLAKAGIEVVGASQLMGHPGQYPSVSLLDWTMGLPNARYYALKLLIDNLKLGDRLADGGLNTADLYALPILTRDRRRKVLFVNKTPHDVYVQFAGDTVQEQQYVDMTAPGIQDRENVASNRFVLHAFAVMFVRLK